jgi:K+-transporting ATPase KdpF subunit
MQLAFSLDIISGLLAVIGLAGYLGYVLIHPERF